jgi:quinolinate synthase
MHLADIPDAKLLGRGCGCATMSRNDPPHLAGMLDLLRQGRPPEINRVLAGDVVDEIPPSATACPPPSARDLVLESRKACSAMIDITEAAR